MKTGMRRAALLLATLPTLLYTLGRERFQPRQVQSRPATLVIGLLPGLLGAFLGIGGGPINVAVLCHFFSMPTRRATQNSLLIVLLIMGISAYNMCKFWG